METEINQPLIGDKTTTLNNVSEWKGFDNRSFTNFFKEKVNQENKNDNNPVIYENFNRNTMINAIVDYVDKRLGCVKTIPYNFSDVKILSDEDHAVGVTDDGFCVYLNLNDLSFSSENITKNSLSGILLYKNDTSALIKEKDYGKIYFVQVPSFVVEKTITVKGNHGIGRLCLSPNQKYCFARLWKGEIIRWAMKDFDKYETVVDKNAICMNVSPDGTIVIGMVDKRLMLFNESLKKIEDKKFLFRIDAYINFSYNGDLIVLVMDSEIKVLTKQNLEIVKEFKLQSQAYDSIMTLDSHFIIAPMETGELAFFDLKTENKPLYIKIHNHCIKSVYLNTDQNTLLTFSLDSKFGKSEFPSFFSLQKAFLNNLSTNSKAPPSETSVFDIESQVFDKQTTDPDEIFKILCFSYSFSSDLLLVSGQTSKILIFDPVSQAKSYLTGHEDYIYSLICINKTIAASGSSDTKIKLWNYRSLELLFTLSGHTDTVTSLVCIDSIRLASGSKDCTVKIWHWKDKTLIISLPNVDFPVLSLFTLNNSFLVVKKKETFQCWEMAGYCLLFEKIWEENEFSKEETKNYEKNQDCEDFIVNLFDTEDITCAGFDIHEEYKFLAYIREIFQYKLPSYNPSMDKWVIFPYQINSLHLYAYYDMPDYLYQSLLNGSSLLNSKNYENPFSISIELKHKDCIKAIIKAAWFNKSIHNYYTIPSIPNSLLLSLNALDITLPKFYELLMVPYNSFTKFCSSKNLLPRLKSSIKPLKCCKNIMEDKNFNKDIEIQFFHSQVPLYLDIGSSKSIEFLNSIIKCGQIRIFYTEIIKGLLLYKWKTGRWVLFIECFLFFGYYLNLILESAFIFEIVFSIFALIMSFMITGINLMVCINSLSISFWNYIDYLRFLLFLLHFIIRTNYNVSSYLLILCIIVSSVQGLYYFKLWKGTRKLIAIITKVIYDVFSFLLLMLFLLIALGSILHIISLEKELHAISTFNLAFGISLNESDEESSDFIENLFLVFMSFVNPLIMLNILLALCADNYNSSKENSKAKDFKEIALMVLRIEHLLFFRRKSNTLKFLHACLRVKKIEVDKYKKINRAIKSVKKEQENNKIEVVKKLDEFEKKMNFIETVLAKIAEGKTKKKKVV